MQSSLSQYINRFSFAIAFACLSVFGGLQVDAQEIKFRPWVSSYQEALQQSRESGKPVMLFFTGSDWSHQSKRMTADVFTSREFAKWSSRNVIKVEVDFPRTIQLPKSLKAQNDMLIQKFKGKVLTYPTVLFIDANENVLGKIVYTRDNAEQWVLKATRLLYRKVDKIAGLIQSMVEQG